MVGHCKFCLLLVGGSIIFHESLALNQAIGITLTLGGIISYAHLKARSIHLYIKQNSHIFISSILIISIIFI